jgi:hypothetical protein
MCGGAALWEVVMVHDMQALVEGYLESAGYNLIEKGPGFIVADRAEFGGAGRDTRLYWIVPPALPEDIRSMEPRLAASFMENLRRFPKARAWLISPVGGGFSKRFRHEAQQLGIRISSPIHFFDAPFKHEEAPETASVARSILERASKTQRIPQPFRMEVPEGPPVPGEDLLPALVEKVGSGEESLLAFIVGPAGIGKSVLFYHLFSELYVTFQAAKRRGDIFPRPIPLMPDYLTGHGAPRTGQVIESFLRAEIAVPVYRRTFEWMLTHGFTTWLWDGLDELYAGDPEFLEVLQDLVTQPKSRGRVLIFARDSLLATSEALAGLLEDWRGDPSLRVYRLEDWSGREKRIFAWLHLEGRAPRDGEENPARVAAFLREITTSRELRDLSGLPQYCEFLLEEFNRGEPLEMRNDRELVDAVIRRMIEREIEKGLIRPEDFEKDGLKEWLEAAALDYLEGGLKGISRRAVEELGEVVLREDLTDDERKAAITGLVRCPLFEPGLSPGTVKFKHEVIAEYLAGVCLSRRIDKDPTEVARRIGDRTDLADSMIGRCIVAQLADRPTGIGRLKEVLSRMGSLPGRQFGNLLQILLLATPDRSIVKDLSLEGNDLSYVRFEGRDLSRTSFRNCDLTGTVFRECDLQEAKFEGAILNGTRFEKLSQDALRGARFGDLERFESVFVENVRIDDFRKAEEWVRGTTGVSVPIKAPCVTVLQLKGMFRKFVHPDGTLRRRELSVGALLRGKRYDDAPDLERCFRAAVTFGFLEGPDFRERVRIKSGDMYDQVVRLVRDGLLTPDLRNLVDALCPNTATGCSHVT